MKTTSLGQSGIVASRIGFGCDPMGGHNWGDVDRAELLRSIDASLDLGINFFDTADVYGLGQSECILAEGLKHRRQRAVIGTKFGVRVEKGATLYDNSPEWIRTALTASLKRLQVDTVDLYQLHYWDGRTGFDDIADVLERLRQEGKIREWGVTNLALGSQLIAEGRVSPVSFSHEFSLAKREREAEILSTVERIRCTFLSWGSLGQGILSGKYSRTHQFDDSDRRNRAAYTNFSAEGRARNLRIVDAMNDIRQQYPSRTLPQIALRWILDRVPGSIALVGIKRVSQIEDAAGALGWSLSAADLERLDAVSKPAETTGALQHDV